MRADGRAATCYVSDMESMSGTDQHDDEARAQRRFRTLWLPLALFLCVAILAPVYVAALEAHAFDMSFLTSICGFVFK